MSGDYKYIYDRPEWPHFRWSNEKLSEKLAAVHQQQGRLIGRIEGIGLKLRDEAALRTLTEEVVKTSEIEGEVLNREQVRSSLARHLGMDIGALTPADRNVEGIVEIMLDATQNYETPLTRERLFGWHAALFPTGRSGMKKITAGAWRTSASGPMQVVSGNLGHERVHYEAPDATRIDREMSAFIAWFNEDSGLDLVLKAAIAHLWFETIHPFEDGNGRIGRALADMMLARSEKSVQRFYSISAQIRMEQGKYYDYLEVTQRGDLEITNHLDWFLGCLDRAFGGAETILADVLRRARFWERQAGQSLNDRQRLVINRLLEGFEGKLTSSKWAKLAKCSQDTAGRDIEDLLHRHILVNEPGRGRSTGYALVVTAADALKVIANYARIWSDLYVTSGPKSLSAGEAEKRRSKIEKLADEIDALAEAGKGKNIRYQDFETMLAELHANGFFPEGQLISAFAHLASDTN